MTGRVASNLLKVLFILWTAAAAFPVRYHHPAPGLDSSWSWVLTEASRQGLIAGSDFAFTYGPLGWITLPMADHLVAGLLWQFSLWALWVAMWAWIAWRTPLLNVAVAAVCIYAGAITFGGFDLFIAFSVLTALACAVAEPSPKRWVFWGIAVALTVLLCFVKLSSAVFAVSAIAMIPVGMYWFVDRAIARRLAATGAIGLAGGFGFLYWIHAGSFTGLTDYLRAAAEISSGYSVAMSLPEQNLDLLDVLEVAAAFTLVAGAAVFRGGYAGVMALATLGPLFLSYKHAIVRPIGHIHILFTTVPLLLAFITLFFRFEKRDGPIGAAIVLLIGVWQVRRGDTFAPQKMLANKFGFALITELSASLPIETLRRKLDDRAQLLLSADIIPGLPSGQPMAVFPWETSYALANHFPLRISPVPQSYSAYTAFLDEKCARFFESSVDPPSRILFDWTALDGRHPLLDVPAWSLAMFRRYGVEGVYGEHLVLKRLTQPRFGPLRKLRTERFSLDQPIRMDVTRPLIAKIHIHWNLRGAVLKLAYKLPELRLVLTGRQRSISARVIPGTLEDGIMANFESIDLASWQALLRDGRVPNPFESLSFEGPALLDVAKQGEIEWFEIPGLNLDMKPSIASTQRVGPLVARF